MRLLTKCPAAFFLLVFYSTDYVLGFVSRTAEVAPNQRRGLHSTSPAIEPFVIHPIDYSAANEYISEHYQHVFQDGLYFDNGVTGPFVEENHELHPKELVHNARRGVIRPNGSSFQDQVKPTLEHNGFTLLQAPSQVLDWKSLPEIKSVYRPELEQLLEDLFAGEELMHIVIWNPMFRGESEVVSNVERDMSQPNPPTSPTAGMVHIDQDLGAYDAEGFLNMIENNRLMEDDGDKFPEIIELVKKGHRFAVINFWRNAGAEPIRRQPLAVFSPYYNSDESFSYFPKAKPDPVSSRWYTYPDMTPDELLVFKQYDRDGSYPSDIWHCALKSITDPSAPPRESFDIRAFVVFASIVDPQKDRFGIDRVRPVLDYEESGEFCDAQAEKRKEAK